MIQKTMRPALLNRASRSLKPLALCAALGLFSVAAFADKKSDYQAAQAAAQAGDVQKAVELYCKVAQEDPNYDGGGARQNCNIYQNMLTGENARNEERFNDAVNFYLKGDFDSAEQKFKQIHSGPHLAETQEYLNSRIPAARKQATAAGAEAAMNQKFGDGVTAYQGNAFGPAQAAFQAVTAGAHQAEAQQYLQKIQQYQQAMNQAKSAAAAKNYSSAISFYQQAANIKGDGPGDPNAQISALQVMAAAAGAAVKPVVPPPPKPVVAAVVESNKPKLDIQKLLRQAKNDEKRGRVGEARGIYAEILSQGPNADAQAGLDALPKDSNQKAGAEADIMLAKGIGEFYNGAFDDSEGHIGAYIFVNGSKQGLAYFYRGVSELTRYYLNGEQPSDKKLLSKAQDDFRNAKKTGGFRPPANMISPKIMKVFDQTS